MRSLRSVRSRSTGEAVICADDGRSDFDRMRAVFGRLGAPDAFLYGSPYPLLCVGVACSNHDRRM
jgi:hypothetical protein